MAETPWCPPWCPCRRHQVRMQILDVQGRSCGSRPAAVPTQRQYWKLLLAATSYATSPPIQRWQGWRVQGWSFGSWPWPITIFEATMSVGFIMITLDLSPKLCFENAYSSWQSTWNHQPNGCSQLPIFKGESSVNREPKWSLFSSNKGCYDSPPKAWNNPSLMIFMGKSPQIPIVTTGAWPRAVLCRHLLPQPLASASGVASRLRLRKWGGHWIPWVCPTGYNML